MEHDEKTINKFSDAESIGSSNTELIGKILMLVNWPDTGIKEWSEEDTLFDNKK